eukprot:3471170-Amphidinium_carterae.1
MSNLIGRTRNVELSTLRVYNVSTKPSNSKPAANAAESAPNKPSKGSNLQPAANAAEGDPQPSKAKGKGDDKKGREPSKPPKGAGCKHGGKCTFFHPRVTREEAKCFNSVEANYERM